MYIKCSLHTESASPPSGIHWLCLHWQLSCSDFPECFLMHYLNKSVCLTFEFQSLASGSLGILIHHSRLAIQGLTWWCVVLKDSNHWEDFCPHHDGVNMRANCMWTNPPSSSPPIFSNHIHGSYFQVCCYRFSRALLVLYCLPNLPSSE